MRRLRIWKRVAPSTANADDPGAARTATRLPAPRTLARPPLQDQGDNPAAELLTRIDEDAATLAELAPTGLQALRMKDIDAWTAWRHQIAATTCSDLKQYLRGLERDQDTVSNAITFRTATARPKGRRAASSSSNAPCTAALASICSARKVSNTMPPDDTAPFVPQQPSRPHRRAT